MVSFLVAALAVAVKPTVVLVHGAGGGGWEWEKWRPIFERQGWRFIAPDLKPARGGLAKTTFEDYRDQVISWCPRNGKVVLVGASMGGILARAAAAKVRPAALVLVDAVPAEGTGKKTYPTIVKWANGPIKDTRDAMPDSDEATIQWAWPQWRDESGSVLTRISAGVPTAPPQCPVLVVIGQDDKDVSPTLQRRVAGVLKSDRLEFAGMSHVGPLLSKRAPEVAELVYDWCQAAIRRPRT